MNREILFRAKCFGNWRYGSYVHFVKKPTNSRCNINYKDFIITNADDGEHYYPISDLSSLGQYTGLKDKNGKKIYEDDIVKTSKETIDVITYDSIAFNMCAAYAAYPEGKCATFFYSNPLEGIEVIGNIYDNPEIMKGGE